jgi:hypothetical protein
MFGFCLNSPRGKARRSLFAHFLSTHLLHRLLFMAIESQVIESLVLLLTFDEKGLSGEAEKYGNQYFPTACCKPFVKTAEQTHGSRRLLDFFMQLFLH